jgi:tryptophan synthase beta subunit
MAGNILDELIDGAIQDMKARQTLVSKLDLNLLAQNQRKPIDVVPLLRREDQVGIIAEIKRSSPSKGKIGQIEDPVKLAKEYEYAGASMISVLTEHRKFGGSMGDLKAVAKAVEIPVLRKDFIVDEYQILEARAAGASCVLLIQAAFEWGKNGGLSKLQELIKYTHSLGMRVLLECHTLDEVKTSKSLDVELIGINTRDLKTFEVNNELWSIYSGILGKDVVKVAESGVSNNDDFEKYAKEHADAVLMGEVLVRSSNPVHQIRDFLMIGREARKAIVEAVVEEESSENYSDQGSSQNEEVVTVQKITQTVSDVWSASQVKASPTISTEASAPAGKVNSWRSKSENEQAPVTTDQFKAVSQSSSPITVKGDADDEDLSKLVGPYFGRFGGRFVPEALIQVLDEFEEAYNSVKEDPSFWDEYVSLLKNYVGRPSALTDATNLAAHFGLRISHESGVYPTPRVFLKREDLNHTGAHKINNALGQALLAKRLGKKRVIAETGAGQHGVATATVCALLGMECVIYMGQVDARRQALNVARMKLLGATVVEVTNGDMILKDAINEALRDWVTNASTTHYLLGTAAGPHPFPTIVRDFQKIIGEEAKEQLKDYIGGQLPDAIVACVGGGSNAIGVMNAFLDEQSVELYGVEAGGEGLQSGKHAVRFSGFGPERTTAKNKGSEGVFQGAYSYLLQDEDGYTLETHSISAGLDYASIGPEHPHLREIGRVNYIYATDDEAMEAFSDLSKTEGIIPALESSHALAGAYKVCKKLVEKGNMSPTILINVSGRGDKDVVTASKYFGLLEANSELEVGLTGVSKTDYNAIVGTSVVLPVTPPTPPTPPAPSAPPAPPAMPETPATRVTPATGPEPDLRSPQDDGGVGRAPAPRETPTTGPEPDLRSPQDDGGGGPTPRSEIVASRRRHVDEGQVSTPRISSWRQALNLPNADDVNNGATPTEGR